MPTTDISPARSTGAAVRTADEVVRVLARGGVDHVFGIPGLHTLALYDALLDEPSIRHIGTRSEAAAAYTADGFTRVAGRPSAILATTGVASFNTLGALSEADLDGSPILLLAGQIPSDLIGQGTGVLHETVDQAAAFGVACGFVARPRTSAEVVAAVEEALDHLSGAYARPAYVELPTDLLEATLGTAERPPGTPSTQTSARPDPFEASIGAAADLLADAHRPVIVAGGAVVLERATALLTQLAEALGAPVLHSVPGRGAIPSGHPLDAGPLVPGHGSGPELLADADAILVAGDRLDAQTIGSPSITFGGPIIQLHPREVWLGRGADVEIALGGPVRVSLESLIAALGASASGRPETDASLGPAAASEARSSLRASVGAEGRPWLEMFDALRERVPADTIVVSDAAAINSWTAFFWGVQAPDSYLFPWGSAALGFALSAGIGASIAAPHRPVLSICGDGGLAFTAMELATAAQLGADVTVVVADDGAYGSIGDYQLARYGRTSSIDLPGPDLAVLAQTFGVPARKVDDPAGLPDAVMDLMARPGPGLVHLTARARSPW